MTSSQVEKNILNDNYSGSSEIFESALKYILKNLRQERFTEKRFSHIYKFIGVVSNRFSSMALVGNGLKQVERILAKYNPEKKNRKEIAEGIETILSEFHDIDKRVIKNSRYIFGRKIKVVTYSQSGLVKKVLAHYRRKLKFVVISEARPAMEGRRMAEYLSGSGVRTKFCVDMLLPELMHGADYFLIGADSVGPDVFINKIGTTVLLKAARDAGLKNVVLYESLKEMKQDPRPADIPMLAGEEIYNRKESRRIEVFNRYFEIIPGRLVHKFISDRDVYTPGSLRRHIKTAGR